MGCQRPPRKDDHGPSVEGRAMPMSQTVAIPEPNVAKRAPVAERGRTAIRRTSWGIAWAGIVLAGLAALGAGSAWRNDSAQIAPPPAPPRVTVSSPIQDTVVSTTILLGQFSAVDTVELRAQVGGVLTGITFQDGQTVHQRDPLFTIDPRPFQIRLDQA